MKRVCLGIHVYAEPGQLSATLRSIWANTEEDCQLLLLPDGPDRATKAALAKLSDLPQSGTAEPCSAAACFNRLATESDAAILVLLESGSIVGPGWLEHLLAALNADPRNGLAGPSTNRAWNEQCVFPNSGGTVAEVGRTAEDAARRFGAEIRTLGSLYSLADFCYVVRREVIEDIGAADEGYSLGPCWEMDYNVRAARAGWQGVWACAAYVYRSPFTQRRQSEEKRRFDASKRRYQDKFCGARLRGEKTDYRPHCRGDACPNFAPSELIKLSIPLPGPPQVTVPVQISEPFVASIPISPVSVSEPSLPLVSCIMPTYNRRAFVPQAIRCFQRQEYPNLELVIVDDGTDAVSDLRPSDDRVRYFPLDRKLTVGAKRNFACTRARGEIIVHWDDDDWYPVWRVKKQVDALLKFEADICGSSHVSYYDVVTDRAWEYRYARSGKPWVAGNTLAYRKSLWERNPFSAIQVGEDTRFVWSCPGNKIADLTDASLCVASLHSGNTSRKDVGGNLWHRLHSGQIHQLLGEDLSFFHAIVGGNPAPPWPLVSCIMPTYNRRPFVPLALRHFLQQDYPNRELIIVDDGDAAVGDLVESASGVRYVRLHRRLSIGAKRNVACELAQGEVIAHWDDDDWYAPDRLRYQVMPILENKADITGLENSFVLDLSDGVFWTTQPELHRRMFVGDVHGGTLVYRKDIWARGPRYPEVNIAEDAWLLRRAMDNGKRLLKLANRGVFVYVRHGKNAWNNWAPGNFIDPGGWQRTSPPTTFPAAAFNAYQVALKEEKNELSH
ncbi:MAG: glycosyltransferase [Acidobacteria bacterium]|nr:glycosyltransferase [Acidobacteriota bacterium]